MRHLVANFRIEQIFFSLYRQKIVHLANTLNMTEYQVQTWFRNRKAKWQRENSQTNQSQINQSQNNQFQLQNNQFQPKNDQFQTQNHQFQVQNHQFTLYGFLSMGLRLLAAEFQKSCSRHSAVHISACHRLRAK